jgi:hypothetical protein
MHRALLVLSAFVAATLPAAAHAQLSGTPREPTPGLSGRPAFHDFCRRDFRHDGDRRHRRSACRTDVVMDWYGGEWALYNNRSWEPESYNDWWHDRPERAYPRWMSRNQDCARRWYSGDVLTC